MTDWGAGIEDALKDFVAVAGLAGASLFWGGSETGYLEAPRKPSSSLPQGKMAIYGFWYGGEWLKIGMAGPKSNALYAGQHYNPKSAQSTLAAPIANDLRMPGSPDFSSNAVGVRIKCKTNRVNILPDAKQGMFPLSLLEASCTFVLGRAMKKEALAALFVAILPKSG